MGIICINRRMWRRVVNIVCLRWVWRVLLVGSGGNDGDGTGV